MICLNVALQILQAFKLHPTLWTPQPSNRFLSLRVPWRGGSLDGALTVCAPDVNEQLYVIYYLYNIHFELLNETLLPD